MNDKALLNCRKSAQIVRFLAVKLAAEGGLWIMEEELREICEHFKGKWEMKKKYEEWSRRHLLQIDLSLDLLIFVTKILIKTGHQD